MKVLKAYEMDGGPSGIYWEVYHDSIDMPDHVNAADFGDYLTVARAQGYDVEINTHESWLNGDWE